jgi:hypothetical protein
MRISAHFESGNAANVEIDGATVIFDARSHGSPQPLWFYFRADGLPEEPVTFVLRNAAACLGGLNSFRVVRPVYSYNQTDWERTDLGEIDPTAGTFTFCQAFARRSTYVAFCYPYTLTRLERYLARFQERQAAHVEVLTRSPAGRPVYHLSLGHIETTHRTVWLTARNHAGETPGSFVLEGFLDWVVSSEDLARYLRRAARVHVVPMVDVDSVVEGAYGKRRPPRDYGESWFDETPYDSVRDIRRAIAASTGHAPYVLYLDLHAPTPQDGHYCYAVEPDQTSEKYKDDLARFCRLLSQHAPPDSPFPEDGARSLYDGLRHSFHDQYRTHGVLSVGLEASYHRVASGDYVTPDSLRRFGAALGRAVSEWLAEA